MTLVLDGSNPTLHAKTFGGIGGLDNLYLTEGWVGLPCKQQTSEIEFSISDFCKIVKGFLYEPQEYGINNRYWVLKNDEGKRFVVTLFDLVALTQYVFTNTDVVNNDPRLELLEDIEQKPEGEYQLQLWDWLRLLERVEGWPQFPPPKTPTQRLSPKEYKT